MVTRKCPQCQKRLRYPDHHKVCPECGFEVADWFEKNQQGIRDAFTGDSDSDDDT